MVTNQQLYLAIGAPMLFNVVLIGMVVAHFNARLDDLQRHLDRRIDDWRTELHSRLNDLRDLWRVELSNSPQNGAWARLDRRLLPSIQGRDRPLAGYTE